MSRTELTGPIDFYFSTSGSNSNPGTAASPKADPVAIYNMLRDDYDLRGHNVCAIGSGVYGPCTWLGPSSWSGGVSWDFKGELFGASEREDSFVIKGDTPNTPNSLQIYSAGPYAIKVRKGAAVTLRNASCVAARGGGLFIAESNSIFQFGGPAYLTTGQAGDLFHAVGPGAVIGAGIGDGSVILLYSASGGGATMIAVPEDNAAIFLSGVWSMSNASFTTFANSDLGGVIDLSGFSWSGSVVSGSGRANASTGGIVFTNTAGQSSLPGTFDRAAVTEGVIE